MTIYSHWINDETPGHETYERKFFGRKSEQQREAKLARDAGKKVLAENEWTIEPKADAVAKFLNATVCSCQADLVEHYISTELLEI